MANIYKRWLCEESLKTPSSRPILIYFEFRSKPSLITVICMDPHSPNKLFATKYCFLILVDGTSLDDTSFFFFISFFFFFFMINFYKNHFIIIIIFSWNFFFHVPGFSGMFRHVPECSVFQVLSTPELQSVFVILFFVLFIGQLSMQLVADNIYLDFLEIYIFFRRLLL